MIVVQISIDMIYKMLSWDSDEATQHHGIQLASNIKNLNLFFQPLTGKAVWENCARIICQKSDDELQAYLFKMLEWLQDMNWPGSDVIFDRLVQMPEDLLNVAFRYSMDQAIETNDIPWQQALNDLMHQRCVDRV